MTTPISDEMIHKALAQIESSEFKTTEVMEKISGQDYRRNKDMAAADSPNARLGKRLSELSTSLKLEHVRDEPYVDKDGGRTQTAVWRKR